MCMYILAGCQTVPRWRTYRRLCITLVKSYTHFSQTIQIGRMCQWISQTPQRIKSVMIAHQNKYIHQ